MAGHSFDDYTETCAAMDSLDCVAAVELNVSCPNVKDGLTFGTHPGRLTLVTPVSPGVTKTSEFSVVGNQIQLSENGIVTGTLTDSEIVVESLVFNRIDATSSDAVKIDLTLSKVFATTTVTATFHGTAVLRGSYAL